MRRLATLFGLLVAVGCGGSDPAGPPPPAPPPPPPGPPLTGLARIVDSIRSAHNLPAMAGAIVTLDGVYDLAVAGTRRAGGNAAVTVDDKWHLGSNLKAMTAALAAMAVDAGVIEWTTTVEEAFPELAGTMRSEYRDVTLEDLLSNRGGIRNDPPQGTYAGATPRAQRESAIAWAVTNPPVNARGTFYYSNVGFVMAGAMVERAWGEDYESLMQSKLWGPIGVAGAGWGPQAAVGSNTQPVAHSYVGGGWQACEACDNPPGLSAAGRAHMPIGDWAKVIQELMKADAGTSTLISAGNGRKLMTAHVPLPNSSDSYGLGWITTTRTWAQGRTVTHDGSNTVNHSVAWLGLGRGLAVIATTNAADLQGGRTAAALDALVGRMITFYLGGS